MFVNTKCTNQLVVGRVLLCSQENCVGGITFSLTRTARECLLFAGRDLFKQTFGLNVSSERELRLFPLDAAKNSCD